MSDGTHAFLQELAGADFGGILQSLPRLERFFRAQRICENAGFAGIMAQTPLGFG
jgi:hypothetical protein